jgi:thiol-disulfide isomerase/thioredoxin
MRHLILCLAALLLASLAPRADQAAALRDHFGDKLLNAASQPVDLATLQGKAVGIYFSAQWCGPCKAFTPELVKFRDAHQDKFEVVFVSSDHSEEAKAEYIKEAGMKWLTVPFKSDVGETLDKRYEVKGIPTLVILKSTGELLTREGRSLVASQADATLINDPAVSVSTAVEEYKCGNCEKMHKRQVVKLSKS